MRNVLYISGLIGFLCATLLFALPSDGQDQERTYNVNPSDQSDTIKVNQLNVISIGFIQKNLDSVFYYSSKAKALSEKLDYPAGNARALLHLSNYYNQSGEYSSATANALSALHLYDSLGLPSSMGDAYAQLAYIYKTMASQQRTPAYLQTGISYSKLAFQMYDLAKDSAGMANSLNISGIIYRDKYYSENNPTYFDTAFDNYKTAIDLVNTSGKGEEFLGKLYNNTSQVYNEYRKDYPKALSYLFKAVEFNESRNNNVSLLYNYGNISATYRQMENYESALKYATNMLIIAREMEQPNRAHDALYELFQIYQEKGEHAEALKYYILADGITDSLSNIEKTNQVADLRAKYETTKKELKIKQLNFEKSNITRRNLFLSLGLGSFILLSIGLIILYRRVQTQKSKISAQSDRLTVMMKELHHRVKNNLQIVSSLLSLQTYKTDDENTIAVFRESQQRVEAMSLIHQRLYNTGDLLTVDMKEYITDLAESLISSFGFHKDDFVLNIDIETEKLDVEKALPIGLIINEMITNAMKYAYREVDSPELMISMKEEIGHLILKIKDNGKGMDATSWEQKTNSFGKQLITALGSQLRAEQNISVDNGTQFTLTIPISKAA